MSMLFVLYVLGMLAYSAMIILSLVAYHYDNRRAAGWAQALCWLTGLFSLATLLNGLGLLQLTVAISCYRISRRSRPSRRRDKALAQGPDNILDAGL